MIIPAQDTRRTGRLLALMKKGDDAFNDRDFAVVDEVHHPRMVAYVTGLAEPVYGKEGHAAAMGQMLRIFPDMHVYSDPYPIQFAATGCRESPGLSQVRRGTGSLLPVSASPARTRELAGGSNDAKKEDGHAWRCRHRGTAERGSTVITVGEGSAGAARGGRLCRG
jgi:hypothetical protein